jgi:hypothetical protein
MKLNKNFIIPMVIILSVFVIGILLRAAPAIPLILVTIMVILPILIIQQNTNNNWGQMFIVGVLLSVVYIAIIIGAFTLANDYEWLKRILIWPY